MRLRIASFNVENLLGHDIRFYDRLIYTAEEADAKINWTAATLTRTKADIVGIQEVWFEDTLKEAVKRSFHFGPTAHVVAPGATLAENLENRLAKRPRLGVVSRYPITSVEVFARFPATVDLTVPLRIDGGAIAQIPIPITQFQRPPLRAAIDVGGTELIAWVAHLKSKGPMIRPGENGDEPFVRALGQARATIVRAAEAAALRHLILTDVQNTSKPTIVLGDLNDTPDAASTQTVRGPSPQAGMDREEMRALWDVVLYSTFRVARERGAHIHTHIYDGERDILDHIMVSQEFYGRNKAHVGEVIRHDVINDHLRDDEQDPKVPGSSDHGIPVAEIELTPAPTATQTGDLPPGSPLA